MLPSSFFVLLGHITTVSIARPSLCLLCLCSGSFHSFAVLLYRESSVLSFSSCLCSALCSSCPLYSHCGRGVEKRCTWEAHLGYSCVAAIGVYLWADGCQCVFTCRSLCVCVWGCIYVEQRYGASEVIWVLVKAPPPQRSFALHLPGFVFLTLSCSSDPFTLCWCLSLAHCCMTVSHQHSPQRAECVPANGGVKAICECLLKNSSSCILFLLFMNLCVRVGGCVPVHVFVVGVKDNLCFAIC